MRHSSASLFRSRTRPGIICIAATILFAACLSAGAQTASPAAQAPVATAQSVIPESEVAMRLPDLNAAEWFDGKAGGTFGEKTVNFLPRSKRVAMVGFKVVFVNENFSRARVRPSYLPGRDTSGASAAMQVNLKGVDDAALQALTDQAFARFVAQLRAAGREVITPDQMQWDYSAFQAASNPLDVSMHNSKGRAFSPTGMPMWAQIFDPWGGVTFDQTNSKAMAEVSNKVGAPLALATSIVVDFAQMASSGNRSGLIAKTAEVGTTLAISVNRVDSRLVRAEEVRNGGVHKGDDGWLNLTRPLETDLEFALLKKTEKDHGGGIGGFLSKAFVGNAKTSFRLAETSNDEYGKAATAVLERATGTLAKLFADNPAKYAAHARCGCRAHPQRDGLSGIQKSTNQARRTWCWRMRTILRGSSVDSLHRKFDRDAL